jgi:hypothetical protein
MGRRREPIPPLDIDHIQRAFAVRQDGTLVRRDHHVAALAHEPATFVGPGNRLMARVTVNGKIRRIAASRIAWALATGQWPKGVVRARNGIDDDLRPENLILTERGPRPFTKSAGGKASSLERRAKTTTTLIRTLSEHPGSTVPQLSRLVGSSAPCVCTRLSKLADMGFCVGPKCDARARWDLTPAGKALAASATPPLDDFDRDILMIIVRSPAKLMALAHRIGSCSLTAKRRLGLLIERGLAEAQDGRFVITDEGRKVLGGAAPRPWVRFELISAANASDVAARHGHEPDDRTRAFRSKIASLGAQQTIATARLRKSSLLNTFNEFDRMAG